MFTWVMLVLYIRRS